jgi:hypothetical protein
MEEGMSDADDTQARKARADAIRRARDSRGAEIESGEPAADEDNESTDPASPNYVDLLDKQMRRDQKRDE